MMRLLVLLMFMLTLWLMPISDASTATINV